MKISDIRSKDIVKLKSLSDEDKNKIIKFATRVSPRDEMTEYVEDFLYNDDSLYEFTLKVDRCDRTKKVPTEYALVLTPDQVFVPIQTRYLRVVSRKHKHPLTNIFA